jgi:thymidylate synthase (FAD)
MIVLKQSKNISRSDMKVRLVGYTQPAEEFRNDFSDVKDLIAFCARVSNPSNQYNTETADKLINYLVRNKHWSPLEMASATIEVETTRDIARQLLRHRSFSFQEFSQRYADPTKDLEFVYREARFQDAKNRQNSVELDLTNPEHRELNNFWIEMQRKVINASRDAYVWAISNGIAKEQARAVLPEGNMASRLYVNGTIRSYVHYIEVRTDPSTQKEHRLLAKAVAEAINKIFSITA